MIINVIGQGYIGLPTSLVLAQSGGFSVVGTDKNDFLINSLISNTIDYAESGFNELLNIAKKNIEFTLQPVPADIYIIAVPTPYIKHSKKIDPKHVEEAIIEVLKVCKLGSIIVIESTISPGTIDKYIRPLVYQNGFKLGRDIHIAHAPERIIPGNMLNELMHNSRTIGVDDYAVGEKIKSVYQRFCKGEIVITDIRTAEMTKVVENTFRDVNIAFANELAQICRSDDLDVYEIIRIANMHPRVNILQPGPGVGGHCISVDPWFLVGDYPGLANIILTARKINDSMPDYVIERIHEIMGKHNIIDVSRVGLYGLTYKENVDDTRESPTLQLLDRLKKHLCKGIKSYDPYIDEEIVDNQFHDFGDFIDSIDLIVIMVGHNHIIESKEYLNDKLILDTRNIFNSDGIYKL